MEVYLVVLSFSTGVILCVIAATVAFVLCRSMGDKMDHSKEERFNDFLKSVHNGTKEPVPSSPSNRNGPRRITFKTQCGLKPPSESPLPNPPVSPILLNGNYNFTIPKATSPGIQCDSFTLEKPQPPIGVLSPTSKTPSMMARLDPSQLDPSAHMYKENHGCMKASTEVAATGPSLGILNFSLKYNSEMGILTIRLIQARDLRPREFSGTADPYCKITVSPYSSKMLQSKVHRKTLCPEFKESFVFDVPETEIHRQIARIHMFDFDQFSRHECIGTAVLPLTNVDLTEKVEIWKEIKTTPVLHRQMLT